MRCNAAQQQLGETAYRRLSQWPWRCVASPLCCWPGRCSCPSRTGAPRWRWGCGRLGCRCCRQSWSSAAPRFLAIRPGDRKRKIVFVLERNALKSGVNPSNKKWSQGASILRRVSTGRVCVSSGFNRGAASGLHVSLHRMNSAGGQQQFASCSELNKRTVSKWWKIDLKCEISAKPHSGTVVTGRRFPVGMRSSCVEFAGSPVSVPPPPMGTSFLPQSKELRSPGDSYLTVSVNVRVNGCLSLYVVSVTHWGPVQGASCLSPSIILDWLQIPSPPDPQD